jgi:ParB family chromosome partitioning protein
MTLAHVKPETREIPLWLLDPPPNPSRVGMEEHELEELARSIRLNGLIQPLIVARDGARYQIVAGHRRSIAAERAGLVAVECRVYPTVTTALMAVQYAENRFRADLSAAEEAILFSDLLEREAGGDVDALCELIGERRTYVEGRLNLFSGDELVFKALLEKKISIGVAHKLNEIDDQRMCRYYLDAAIRGGATIAVVTGWVQQWKQDSQYTASAGAPPSPSPAPSAVPQMNYFTCACCDGTDNPHLMVPINVHQHCKLAILDKLIAAYKGQA